MEPVSTAFAVAAMVVCGTAVLATAAFAKSMIFTVKQQSESIIETFGKFARVAGPGLHFKWPVPISRIAATLDKRLAQSDFKVEVRTKDNAFVIVPISLHHKVTDAQKAFYELNSPEQQMESFASNVVRSQGAQMTLAELYEAQDTIKTAVKRTLDEKIGKFGYEIEDVVVSQPQPSAEVKSAFDRVISSQRALEAAENEAEAIKIKTVRAAEAEAEAMEAYGRGIANQRKRIAEGFKEAVKEMESSNLAPEQAIALMVMTNAQETLAKASAGKGSVILGSVRGEDAMNDMATLTARLTALRHTGIAANDQPKVA